MSTAPLSAPAWAKFVKVAGLLASDHDGERANAARMATDLLRQHRMTWGELLARLEHDPPPAAKPREEPRKPRWSEEPWQQAARRCMQCHELLTAWEQRFIASILMQRRLTPKQRAVLDRITSNLWGSDDDC